MKSSLSGDLQCPARSPPSRVAWIEIDRAGNSACRAGLSPPSRVAWIEITPTLPRDKTTLSPPSRAAWIEISLETWFLGTLASPPSRAAWIEIQRALRVSSGLASPPSRAAWIEICLLMVCSVCTRSRRPHGRRGLKLPSCYAGFVRCSVAALTGGVD